ncbi:PHP domain-containing protein [Clostridium beijerinckii]|uniref:Polymerase/histidinol phosphatase N-terminal domain-containing protein n=1 Tax=Clostridium beijerinckii TaxID=1520 RepID=A0AAX0B1G5_CLOBE|nr:PHP domain-containing protein [Clostridium beijerinckii]NRT88941.1 hypothetical protein [Clostridium beijerinckii]NYC74396.1 putative metal-dependent phosphoesterase TrpH [Clostridium beijerinckii]
MLKVDFHVHTTYSDGILSPSDIVKRAHRKNVKYLAITDHDTIDGLNEAISESYKYDISLIPGIELSTQNHDENVHILGFFKDNSFHDEELTQELMKIKNHRIIRAKSIIEKLKNEFNIEISFEKIFEHAKNTIARSHIANEIINCGYPFTINEIFEKFIGTNCKAYVPTLLLSTIDGLNLLKKHNAIVLLAHPKLIFNSDIDEFLNMNFDGIEAIYYQNTFEENKKFIKFANDNNLLISAGSDFHGNLEEDTFHGDIGSMNLPHEYLSKLLSAINISSTN